MQLDIVRKKVAEISGQDARVVRVVACPYRICPLGAHIDHQVTGSFHFLDILICKLWLVFTVDKQYILAQVIVVYVI